MILHSGLFVSGDVMFPMLPDEGPEQSAQDDIDDQHQEQFKLPMRLVVQERHECFINVHARPFSSANV